MATHTTLKMAIALMACIVCVTLAYVAQSSNATHPTISFDRPIHFTTPTGEDVIAQSGTYHVELAGEGRLRLESSQKDSTIVIQAQDITHEGTLTGPVLVAISGNDDQCYIVLLLPNGIGLEAVGSTSGVKSRGSTVFLGGSPTLQAMTSIKSAGPTRRQSDSISGVQASPALPSAPKPKLFPAQSAPSPELQLLLQPRSSPTLAQQRPSTSQLLDQLRSLPGGLQTIELARQSGARISMSPAAPPSLLSWLAPFTPSDAYAAGAFSITLTPAAATAGPSYVTFDSVRLLTDGSIWFKDRSSYPGGFSSAYLWLVVPTTGWYLVDVEAAAYAAVSGKLFHYDPNSSGWNTAFAAINRALTPPVQTWTYPSGQTKTTRSYPALLQLAAGAHELNFLLESGSVQFLEVTIHAL